MPNRHDQSPDFSLPDFSGAGGSTAPGADTGSPAGGGRAPSAGRGPMPGSGGDPGSWNGSGGSRRGLWIAGCAGASVLLLIAVLVVVLVLNRTVLGGGTEQPTASGGATTASQEPTDAESTRGEYIPTEEETTEPQPEQGPTMTVAPSTECTLYPAGTDQEQPAGELRGGGLSVPLQDDWEVLSAASVGEEPHLEDTASAWTPVEGGWYTGVSVGRVAYPDGAYPGPEAAARHLFECAITREDSSQVFGDQPVVSDLSEQSITVDGYPAHRFEATVAINGEVTFESTDGWRYVAIVVETPGGPSAIVAGAATGHDDQMADLEAMTEGLIATA